MPGRPQANLGETPGGPSDVSKEAMKKLLALVVLGGLGFGTYTLVQNGTIANPFAQTGPAVAKKAPPGFAILPERTPVTLVLLERLESGTSEEGLLFKFAVKEDVKASDGKVILKKGSTGTGEVVWSRRGQTLAALANQPARLAVKVVSVTGPNGLNIPLVTEEEQYEFRDENTKVLDTPAINPEQLSPAQKEAVAKLQKDGVTALKDPETRRQLSAVLGSQAKDATGKEGQDLAALGAKLATGDVASLGSGDLDAILGLGAIGSGLFDRLGGMVKARQIVAPMGVEIPAFVARDTKIPL